MENNRQSPFSAFFKKLPRIFTAGIIFSAIFAGFTALAVLLSKLTGFSNIILWALGIIPSAPFYAGLVEVIRKYAVQNEFCPAAKTFFGAVKRCFLPFLLYGATAYLIICCSFFAVLYYYTLSRTAGHFVMILAAYLIFAAFLVTALFYLPIIGASYKLKIREVYSNSIKLVFRNFGANLIALAAVGVIAALAASTVMFSAGFLRIAALAGSFLLCPTVITYIIVSLLSKGVQEELGSFVKKPAPKEEKIEIKTDNTEDDYIFVNGKMIRNPNKTKE